MVKSKKQILEELINPISEALREHRDLVSESYEKYNPDINPFVTNNNGGTALYQLEEVLKLWVDLEDVITFERQQVKCVVCHKEIEELDTGHHDLDKTPLESRMWNEAIVESMSAGYGSSHDGENFLIGLCIECLEKGLENNSITKQSKEYLENKRKYYRKYSRG